MSAACRWVVPLALLLAACPIDDPAPTLGEGSAETTPTAAAAEAEVAQEPSAADALADEASEGSGAPVLVPPPLPDVMQRLGYTDPTEVALAEFVPVPPGATGEAGAFGRGERTVRVALVRYANERFAGPHVRDLAERRALLPDSGEAYLHAGRFVVHIEAVDRATADALAAELADALRWPRQD